MFHHSPPFPLKSPFSVGFPLARPATVARRYSFRLKLFPTVSADNHRRDNRVFNVPGRRPTPARTILRRARRLKLYSAM